jgi:hypothetical protein
MRAGKFWCASLVTLVALCGSAHAATVIGNSLDGDPTNNITATRTFVNTTLAAGSTAPGGVSAPQGGVVTRWSLRTQLPAASNTTIRPVVIGGNTALAKGDVVDAPEWAGVAAFSTRLSIAPGQLVGVELGSTSGPVSFPSFRQAGGAASNMRFWDPPLILGNPQPPTGDQTNSEILVQATIEPDTDGDGFGDESQDGCVGTAGSQAGCVPPVAPPTLPTRPDTQITSGPTETKKPKAIFTFSSEAAGATFECALDKDGFSPCSSPTTLKRLKRGSHRFRVRAISAEGLVDASPAEQAFKVKRKRKPK